MAKQVLMDEFHLTVFAPCNLPAAAYDAIRLALDDPRFRAHLKRAVRRVVARRPSLSTTRFRLSR